MSVTIVSNPDGTVTVGCGAGGAAPAPAPGVAGGSSASGATDPQPSGWGDPAGGHLAYLVHHGRLWAAPARGSLFHASDPEALHQGVCDLARQAVEKAVEHGWSGKQPVVVEVVLLPGQHLDLDRLRAQLADLEQVPTVVIHIPQAQTDTDEGADTGG